MAVGAVDLREIADIHGMLKRGWERRGGLRHHGVTLVAVFADHASVSADVLAVMAAKTSRIVVVADIVGMCQPVQLHIRKSGAAVELLNFRDRIADL